MQVVREMDAQELAQFEAILCRSDGALQRALQSLPCDDDELEASRVFRQLWQYFRFWSGMGHRREDEYR